jgi:photosystem II stability/assembly factor-like uncharacterized protein
MKNNLLASLIFTLLCAFNSPLSTAFAQSTAFTYQGSLSDNGGPATGSYNLQFSLWNAANGPTQVGGTLTTAPTAVSNGRFTVTLDFGNQFSGGNLWLQIAVATNGSAVFTTLSPRQALTPTPYAIYSATAATAASANSVAAANISGTIPLTQLPAALVTNGASGVNISGTFSGNGSGLTSVPGTLPPQVTAATSVTAQPNTVCDVTSGSTAVVTLPATANVGDVVQVNGTGSGGWLINNHGTVWTPREISRSWEALASSADGTKLVAADIFGKLYTSTNRGVTWTPRENDRPWQGVASSQDGTKLAAVSGGNGQIYTSTDSGVTWTPRETNRWWQAIASSINGANLVAVDSGNATGGRIYTSTDSGATWTPRESDRSWISVASSSDGTQLVAADQGGRLYTSTDGGVFWTPRESDRRWFGVASSGDGTKLVAVVDGELIYTSTDSGVTWTPRESVRYWKGVASSWDGTKLIAVADNGDYIYTSTDSGATWTPRESIRNWSCVASSADGNTLIAGGNNQRLYISVDPLDGGVQGTSAQFQYVGNGVWQHLTPTGRLSGDANSLTNLNASQLSTGTVTDARLSGNVALLNANQTFTGASTFSGSGNSFTGNGTGLTSLNASNLTSGNVADARLSTNAVLRNANQTFTGLNTFSAAGNNFSGNGAGLTSLNATNLTSGTVADTRLSTNVALRSGGNTFTGNQIISSGNLGIGTTSPSKVLEVSVPSGDGLRITGPGGGGTTVVLDLTTYNPAQFAATTPSARIQATDNTFSSDLDFQTKTPGAATNTMASRLFIANSGNVGIGTNAPQTKLQVVGDVKLGSSGQYFAPAGEENLRIVRGSVSSAGALVAGSGFTASRTANATYLIAFTTAFSSAPTIVVSCGAAGQTLNSVDAAVSYNTTTTNFNVQTGLRNAGYFDEPFSFIAIGPR